VTAARVRRGRESERALASYMRANGWPFAEPCPAFAPGPDVTGVPGVSLEIKSRTRPEPGAAMKQAEAHPGLAVGVFRLNGTGTSDPGSWLAMLRVRDLVPLMRSDGYGDPLPEQVTSA